MVHSHLCSTVSATEEPRDLGVPDCILDRLFVRSFDMVPPPVGAASTASDEEAEAAPACCICLEAYHPLTSPPCRLTPCSHHVCQPCYDLLYRSRGRRRGVSCPICRAPVSSSRVDMSILEQHGGGGGGGGGSGDGASDVGVPFRVEAFVRPNEYIRDRCQIAFYGIDNSGSMGHQDGKTFLRHVTMTPASNFEVIAASECQQTR